MRNIRVGGYIEKKTIIPTSIGSNEMKGDYMISECLLL